MLATAPLILLLMLLPYGDFPLKSHSLQVLEESALVSMIPVGQKQFLLTPIDNTLAKQVNCTVITTVFDKGGYPDSISTLDVQIPALQSVVVIDQWTPQKSSNYTILQFIVSDNNVPTLMAEPQGGNIVVTGQP